MKKEIEKALSFWQIAFQYLDLSENVASLISENGNKWIFHQKGWNWEDLKEDYARATKWTDYNHGIPVIFNFYHGIEVLLKGFVIAENKKIKGHKLTSLLHKTKELHPDAPFFPKVEKYLNLKTLPEILKNFVQNSSSQIDEWYQSLKYPESFNGKPFEHDELQYKQEEGAQLYEDLSHDIHEIRILAVKYARGKYEGLA
jgi:hypothetical protein